MFWYQIHITDEDDNIEYSGLEAMYYILGLEQIETEFNASENEVVAQTKWGQELNDVEIIAVLDYWFSSNFRLTSGSGETLRRKQVRRSTPNVLKTTPRIEFLDVNNGNSPVEEIDVVQGLDPARVAIRIVPKNVETKLSLCFAAVSAYSHKPQDGDDAALRRIVNRSGQGPDDYLPRVRIAEDADGIRKPWHDLAQGPREFDYASDAKPTFSILGVEAGQDRLIATVFSSSGEGQDPPIVASLSINIKPSPVGAFRVYHVGGGMDFRAPDAEFAAIHALAPAGGSSVKLAVLDNGIGTSDEDLYLSPQIVGQKSFLPDEEEQSYAEYFENMDDAHGSNVSGQAAWGTPFIKILDCRMAKGQLGGDESTVVAPSMRWALNEKQADVLTTSVAVDWSNAEVAAAVQDGVLYCATAGNNTAVLDDAERPKKAPASGLLAARCHYDRGTGVRTKHLQTGLGEAVDVILPGDFTTLYCHRAYKLQLNHFVEERFEKRNREYEEALELHDRWEEERKAHLPERPKSMALFFKWKRDCLDLEEAWLKDNPQPLVGTQPDRPKIRSTEDDIDRDAGISFGVPVLANIAAKMKLIHPGITAAETKSLIIDTSDRDPGFEELCRAKGVVNPLRAYLAAFDAATQ
ncbi:MAG TPA: hypothetical protein ENJ50_06680 [Planctomycetaceae bacterium]|nr:hypothetical protein [Planctomycetaceae bacterium]